jgi:tetratricopeptide (TPR) repeat protein
MLTREGGRALTPEYAAPEQMLDEPITTATDVYALGVLLYVLLCGRHPAAATATSPAHLVRAIVDTIPGRPSDTAATLDDAALARRTTPERLRRTLRGDLDTIVAKALRKKPAERYRSVTAFADDLRRYLQNEPISARPDSLTYRGAKFVRRHARAVAAIVVVVVALAALTIFYTRRLAVERDRARLEAQKSAQITELLTGLLTGADPYDSRGGSDVTVRGILDAGAARVETELAGQPDLQAEILTVIGRVYQRLEEFDKAQPLLEKAVALGRGTASGDSARTAASLNDLGVLIASRGDVRRAQPVLEDALAMRRRVLGHEHGDVAVTLVELARVFEDQNADDRAEPLLRESLAIRRKVLGEEASETATSMSDLGLLLLRRGDTGEAGRLLEQVLAISRKVLPPSHPNIATAHNNVALISMARGDFARAEAEFRQAFAIREKGPAASLTANHTTLANFSAALREQGKYDEAAQAMEKALEVSKPLGVDHAVQATYKMHLARIEIARHRAIDGEQLAREALRRREQLYDNGDWRIGSAKSVLGEALTALGRYREAEPLLIDAHAVLKDVPGAQGRDAKATRERLVALYVAWGRPEAAAPYRADGKKD